jgi:DNA topoisomerase-1
MAVPPAYRDVRYSADPSSHLQAVGIDAAGPAAVSLPCRLGKGPRAAQGASPGAAGGRLPKIRRKVSAYLSGDEPTREFALSAVIELIARTAIRPGQRILCPPQRHPRRDHDAEIQRHAGRRQLRPDLQGQGRQGRAQGMRRRQAGARHRHPAHRARASACSSNATIPAPVRTVSTTTVNAFLREIAGIKISLKDFAP